MLRFDRPGRRLMMSKVVNLVDTTVIRLKSVQQQTAALLGAACARSM